MTPTPAWSSSASTCWQPVPDAATRPTGPGWTTLAKPSPRPPTTAVPQSGPITSSPCSAAARFSATSCSTGTLSLKIITSWPLSTASIASTKALAPGHRDQRDRVGGAAERGAGRARRRLLAGAAVPAPPGLRERARDPGQRGVERAVLGQPDGDHHVVGRRLGGHLEAHLGEHLDVERGGHRDLRGRDARRRPGRSGSPGGASPSRRRRPSGARRGVVMPPPSQVRRAPAARPRPGRGPSCARSARTCLDRPRAGQPGRELGHHLAGHRALQQRGRQQRRRPGQRPHLRVHRGSLDPGAPRHREPAAEHVVAVRRQPVAATDQARRRRRHPGCP